VVPRSLAIRLSTGHLIHPGGGCFNLANLALCPSADILLVISGFFFMGFVAIRYMTINHRSRWMSAVSAHGLGETRTWWCGDNFLIWLLHRARVNAHYYRFG
jgi:hypothetical protein